MTEPATFEQRLHEFNLQEAAELAYERKLGRELDLFIGLHQENPEEFNATYILKQLLEFHQELNEAQSN